MPIHDWSRVDDGIFHDFHQSWVASLRNALNLGVLPGSYYALIEQRVGRRELDVLTLQANTELALSEQADEHSSPHQNQDLSGVATVVKVIPQVEDIMKGDEAHYAAKQSSVVVRQVRNDRIVALIEIVSRGNKTSEFALERFVEKVTQALASGINVVIVDLHRPHTWDPEGIHNVIWRTLVEKEYKLPPGKLLMLASYTAYPDLTAYVQSCRVGDNLRDMPLFLDEEHYVPLPLEASYLAAYQGMPQRWRAVLEAEN